MNGVSARLDKKFGDKFGSENSMEEMGVYLGMSL
jgi:hypothetical protein